MKLIGSKISRKDKNELPENRIFGRIRDYGKSIWLTIGGYSKRFLHFFSVKTVFIAVTTVFVVMTTVFMQGELRTSEP